MWPKCHVPFSFLHDTNVLRPQCLSAMKPKTCLFNPKFRFVPMHRLESIHVQIVAIPVYLCSGSKMREECTAVERYDVCWESQRAEPSEAEKRHVWFVTLESTNNCYKLRQLKPTAGVLSVLCLWQRACVSLNRLALNFMAVMNAWITPVLETGYSCSGVDSLSLLEEWIYTMLLMYKNWKIQNMQLHSYFNFSTLFFQAMYTNLKIPLPPVTIHLSALSNTVFLVLHTASRKLDVSFWTIRPPTLWCCVLLKHQIHPKWHLNIYFFRFRDLYMHILLGWLQQHLRTVKPPFIKLSFTSFDSYSLQMSSHHF